MADGGDNSEHRDNRPDTIRRQVVIAVRTVVDVPTGWTEDEVRKYAETEICRRDIILSVADEIEYDIEERKAGRRPAKTDLCDVCALSTVKLVPIVDEVESKWLENLGLEEDDEKGN